MGMYDQLWCEYPLPEHPEFQDRMFQTQDLQRWPNLDYFLITKEGRLKLLERDCEGNEDPVGPPDRSSGDFYKFTGDLYFYDFVEPTKCTMPDGTVTPAWRKGCKVTGPSGWVEYKAVVEDGQVTQLRLYEYSESLQNRQGPSKVDVLMDRRRSG